MTAASTIASALRRSLESAERAWKGGESAYAYGYITQAVEQALRELAIVEDSKPAGGEQTGAATHLCFLGGRTCDTDPYDRCRDCPFGGLEREVSDEEADRIAEELVGPVLSSHVQRSYPAGPARLAKRFPIHPVKGGRRG